VLLSGGSVASPAAKCDQRPPRSSPATGGAALGLSSLGATGGLSLGAHSIEVTQSSAAAAGPPAAPPTGSVTITSGSNDTISLSANGTAYNLTLAAGTYTRAHSSPRSTTAAGSAGAPDHRLTHLERGASQLATNEQGSAATLSLTGGDALSALRLTSGASGNGVSTRSSRWTGPTRRSARSTRAAAVTLNAPTGAIQATVAGTPGASGSLISLGSASAALVSTGNGSLSGLVFGHQLLRAQPQCERRRGVLRPVPTAGHRRWYRSRRGGPRSIRACSPSGALDGVNQVTAAADAVVNVGGASGYDLTSSTNTFSNLLAGTARHVATIGSATVSVAGTRPARPTRSPPWWAPRTKHSVI